MDFYQVEASPARTVGILLFTLSKRKSRRSKKMFSALHPTLTDGDFPALPMLQRGEREGGLKKTCCS